MPNNAPAHVENVLSRLNAVHPSGAGWQARCPCRNDDENPSLSVGIGQENQVLLFCQKAGGCSVSEICDSIGLKVADLWDKDGSNTFTPPPKLRQPKIASPVQTQNKEPDKWTEVETYDYVDVNGELLFQKVRLVNQHGKKSFRQRKPDGEGGWNYKVWEYVDGEKQGPDQVLYNLPSVAKAIASGVPVWVVEGEKDANTLIKLGYVATTMTGGAGNNKWLDIHTETLAGGVIEIIADNDEPGRIHAENVYNALSEAGCDAQIWISETHKDVTDHLAAGNTMDELVPIEEAGQTMIPVDSGEPIEDEPVKSATQKAVEDLLALLTNDDLSDAQKVAKTGNVLRNAFAEEPLDAGRLVVWNEFLKEAEQDNYDWAIPGVLERGERVIVVAAEGVGKTMLARQVAILSASGVHPFTFQQMPPVRTLTVDLENPERIIRRTSRKIMHEALKMNYIKNPLAHLMIKPSGLNLLMQDDRAIFERAIEEVKPELLCIGPLYKSFVDPGGKTAESVAIEIAKYLDSIRTIYGCAMWIEHHAPLGTSITSRDLRPFGSAVWSRWPEFGISLQPDPTAGSAYIYDVRHFRGARDERAWPLKMRRGQRFPFEVLEYMKVNNE